MSVSQSNFLPKPRQLVFLIIGVTALYVVIPQFGDFRSSWQLVRHPDVTLVLAAIMLTLVTYVAAAATYCFLAIRPLPFGRTVLVQLAAMFINRLLPAGVGALGTNYVYLRRQNHTAAAAASIVALNNVIGFAGHSILLIITVVLASPQSLALPSRPTQSAGGLLTGIAIALIIIIIGIFIWGRQRLKAAVSGVFNQLLSYRHRPHAVLTALASSTALTFFNVACFVCCLAALGVHLPFLAVLLVFTFGVGAGAATPTPGGLGGFEAGLAGGLLTYHVAHAEALAAAILYRLVSYWLPLALGAGAFIICQQRGWLDSSHLHRAKH